MATQTLAHVTHAAAIAAALVISMHAGGTAASRRFYADDPLARIADSADASAVGSREIDLVYDTLENSFSQPGDKTPNVRARNVNTIDEVPDSNWFTNRIGSRALTVEELLKGPDTVDGPADGPWTVIRAKSDGVTPGFTIRDAAKTVWFLKVDPPGYRAMASGTEVVVTKLFWALGYHVPEVHLASLRPEQLTIDESATITAPNGSKRQLKAADIAFLLRRAARDADGSYRVIASKALEGRALGGFRFYGTRSDDPNDLVPHEHRRELRAYGTFAAWVNHVDSKSINTLDTLIQDGDRQVIRHHLLDFGSTIGSAGVYPREAFEGSEYLVEGKKTLLGLPTFGLYMKEWRTTPMFRASSVGSFRSDHARWDPETWKSRYSNSAFRSARLDDKFWAARRLQGFTDEMLRALPRVGQFNDPTSEQMLSKFLIDRRDAIVRRYLPALNPVVEVQLDPAGQLTFRNAAVEADLLAAPAAYAVNWFTFDNATGATTLLGSTTTQGHTPSAAPRALPATAGSYVEVQISAESKDHPAWQRPIRAYFLREVDRWKLVGLERLPDDPRNSRRG